ncbi:MAG: serine/threonine-protein kinase, partial [Myxococcota bacterium]|nr:serine/threonine-protein kinase [Myxococcota bacterium]
VARLTHRNIPEIHDFSSSADNLNYLVTELVDGASMADLLREAPPMLPEVGVMMCLGVCEALVHAHAHQVIHRDVKPENILMGRDGVVKLTDFGIAQIVGLESMTITGTLVGSPAHMSPEQVESSRDLDERADIWALGTVLYGTSTGGSLPFDSPHPHGVLRKIVEGKYEDPRRRNPHVNSALAGIIGRCLKRSRDERYQTMMDLGDALRQWLEERAIKQPARELKDWMADHAGYQQALGKRLVVQLMGSGDRFMEEGNRHGALEAYGRVLTLQPDHEEALTRVKTLHSDLRMRRLIRHALLTVLAIASLSAVVLLWPEPEPPPLPQWFDQGRVLEALPSPGTEPTDLFRESRLVVEMGAFSGTSIGQQTERAGKLVVLASKPVPRTTAPTMVPVRFSAEPPAVTLTLDGRPVRKGTVIQVRAGTHQAVLTHPQCPTCGPTKRSLKIQPTSSGKPAKVHLKFRYPPALVTVRCKNGTVSVNGKVYGPCGKTYRVPVLTHKAQTGKIVVSFPGRPPSRPFKVRITPGARIEKTL